MPCSNHLKHPQIPCSRVLNLRFEVQTFSPSRSSVARRRSSRISIWRDDHLEPGSSFFESKFSAHLNKLRHWGVCPGCIRQGRGLGYPWQLHGCSYLSQFPSSWRVSFCQLSACKSSLFSHGGRSSFDFKPQDFNIFQLDFLEISTSLVPKHISIYSL